MIPTNQTYPLIFSDKDFEKLNFSECYLYGLKWEWSKYRFIIDLDYRTETIKPTGNEAFYKFKISPAQLCFNSADTIKIDIEWKEKEAIICQIEKLYRGEYRLTPNGKKEWYWELRLFEGIISLWALDFELKLLTEPKISPMYVGR